MNDCQASDEWIANYQTEQRQKQQKFLRAVKYEFIERTTQQRRDRLNQIAASQPAPEFRTKPLPLTDYRLNQIAASQPAPIEHSASPRRALKSNHKIL